ncbi:hypothetical protein RUM43_005805 [Polyplax serrata]|uniref:Uncharacterized protein n=1 Tax=Polyplax serrata TaxID=468196 RepID=A0AAN8PXP4_POLSC
MVPTAVFTLHSWNSTENGSSIENEEWLAFLQRNMEELMAGQLDCLKNTNLVSVVIAPLRNYNASPKVLEYVANMLALPFVVTGPSEKEVENIEEVYLEAKVLPNLIYASKIIARNKNCPSRSTTPSAFGEGDMQYQSVSELSSDELQALEAICLLICYLVHCNEDFLIQFCDAVAILNAVTLLQQFLLLGRRKLRVVTDYLAIFNLILQQLPENADLVEQIILGTSTGDNPVDLSILLTHPSSVVRFRTCELIRQLTSVKQNTQLTTLSPKLEQNLNLLLSDSSNSVHMAAEEVLQHLKKLTIPKHSE